MTQSIRFGTHRRRAWSSSNRTRVRGAIVAALGFLASCSSHPPSEYPTAPPAGVRAEPSPVLPAPPGAVWRHDLTEAIDAGLGPFLQRLEVEAEFVSGGFVGWRVMRRLPSSWWQGIDLEIGDVVTAVNGMPIEKPEQAHAAFTALRSAERIVVSYLRGGQERELIYRIVEAEGAKPSASSVPVQSGSLSPKRGSASCGACLPVRGQRPRSAA